MRIKCMCPLLPIPSQQPPSKIPIAFLHQTNNSKIRIVPLLYPKADFNDARHPLYTKYVVPEGTDRGKQNINVNLHEGNCQPKGQSSASQPIVAR